MLMRRLPRCHQSLSRNFSDKKRFKKFTKNRDEEERVALVRGEILYGYFPVLMALKAGRRNFHSVYYNHAGNDRMAELVDLAVDKGV